MGEVKAESVGPDEGALLAHVVAEHGAQARVQEVRRRVVAPRGLAPLGVDRRHGDLAGQDLPVSRPAVREESARHVLGVEYLEAPGLGDDGAGVADLAARLGVEGSRVQEEFALAVLAREHAPPPSSRASSARRRVPRTRSRRCRSIRSRYWASSATRRVFALLRGAFALCGHRLVKGLALNAEPASATSSLGQLDRKAVRVVEFKGNFTRKDRAPCCDHFALRLFEERETRAQRASKARLFALEDLDNEIALVRQRRVRGPIFSMVASTSGSRDRGVRSGATRRENRPTNDASQHVPASLVGRQHPVGDEHGHGPPVVGHATNRDVDRSSFP